MKKTWLLIILIMFAILLFTGCFYIRIDGNSISGNGQMTTKEVELNKELKGVRNHGSFEVIIDPSLKGKAVLEGESNLLELLQLEQDSFDVLDILFKPNTAVLLHKTITVRSPAFAGGLAETDGSGNILLQGSEPMQGDLYELRISGSGRINLILDTKELRSTVNGSGDISLKGKVDKESININGSGNFDAFECVAKNAEVSINGSGKVNVFAENEIKGTINGSGDIAYKGDPKNISVDDHGSGNIYKK